MQRKITNNFSNSKIFMKELLKQISVVDYPAFREKMMQRAGWSYPQYNARLVGKVKLSQLEREAVQQVIDEINNPDCDIKQMMRGLLR